jgi:hypothetical protein
MNICYRISGEGLEDEFVKLAAKQGMTGLKGHRSVGGIRISNCKDPCLIFLVEWGWSNYSLQITLSLKREQISWRRTSGSLQRATRHRYNCF